MRALPRVTVRLVASTVLASAVLAGCTPPTEEPSGPAAPRPPISSATSTAPGPSGDAPSVSSLLDQATPCASDAVSQVPLPHPVLAVFPIDACRLLVATDGDVEVLTRAGATPVWAPPAGSHSTSVAYSDGTLWWAGDTPDGPRVIRARDADGHVESEIRLPAATEDVSALRVMGRRVIVAASSRSRSVVGAVDSGRFLPLAEHDGRLAGLAADADAFAAVFLSPAGSTVVWGAPSATRQRTWPGAATVSGVSIRGSTLAVGLTRLDDSQVPDGSTLLLSTDGGRRWSAFDQTPADLSSVALVSSQVWVAANRPGTPVGVFRLTASGRLVAVPGAGTSEESVLFAPVDDAVWAVGGTASVLRPS